MRRLLERLRGKLHRPAAFYDIFEEGVIHALNLILAVIIAIALIQLYAQTVPLVLRGALNPLHPTAFEDLFSAIFTLIIALEFRHSIGRATSGRTHAVQVRTVILIALLAITRKFVILDTVKTSAATIASLAAVTLVLGAVYWLLRTDEVRGRPRPPEAARPTQASPSQ